MLAVAVGSVLGGAAQIASDVHPALRWAAALGVPWLVTAFFAGALLGDRARGAFAGAAALVLGTLTYYVLRVALNGEVGLGIDYPSVPIVVGWCAAAVCGGGVFGLAGAAWRRGGERAHVLAVAVVSGALVGEALLLRGEWSGRGARLVLGLELAAGALMPLALTRRRALVLPALALTAVLALCVGVAEDGVRDALRDAGWNGA